MDLTPGEDQKRDDEQIRDLRAEVERLTALMRTVDLLGIGFVWTDPRTGAQHMLHPADVAVVLHADQQTEVEKIGDARYQAGREDAARERDEELNRLRLALAEAENAQCGCLGGTLMEFADLGDQPRTVEEAVGAPTQAEEDPERAAKIADFRRRLAERLAAKMGLTEDEARERLKRPDNAVFSEVLGMLAEALQRGLSKAAALRSAGGVGDNPEEQRPALQHQERSEERRRLERICQSCGQTARYCKCEQDL